MLRGVNKFAQNGAPQSRRQTEQWQMLDETIASASINEIRVLPQKHSPGVGGFDFRLAPFLPAIRSSQMRTISVRTGLIAMELAGPNQPRTED